MSSGSLGVVCESDVGTGILRGSLLAIVKMVCDRSVVNESQVSTLARLTGSSDQASLLCLMLSEQ